MPAKNQVKAPEFNLEAAFAPVKALNTLVLENTAKVVELQFAAARKYADLALASTREVSELKDAEAFQAYVAKQPEAMKHLAEDMAADAQEMTKLGMSYVQEAGKVVAESVKKAA